MVELHVLQKLAVNCFDSFGSVWFCECLIASIQSNLEICLAC